MSFYNPNNPMIELFIQIFSFLLVIGGVLFMMVTTVSIFVILIMASPSILLCGAICILPIEDILNLDMVSGYESYILDFNIILFWVLSFTGLFNACQSIVAHNTRHKIDKLFITFLLPILVSLMYVILWELIYNYYEHELNKERHTTIQNLRLNLSIIITLIVIRKLPLQYLVDMHKEWLAES